MKKLVVLALMSVSVFAFERVSSPTVLFPGVIIPLHLTCLNDNGDLQSTFMVQRYKRVDRGDNSYEVPTFKEFVTTPVNYTRTECVDYGKNHCEEYRTFNKSYPLTTTVKIYEVERRRENDVERLVRTEEFSVPACK